MRRMQENMRRAVALLVVAFLIMGGYFAYTTYFYGSRWFNSVYNPRIVQAKQEVRAGTLFDRNGQVLAHSDASGQRKYQENSAMRHAVSHVVGDGMGRVPGGAESFFAGDLLGFRQGLATRVEQMLTAQGRKGDDVTLTIDAQLQGYIHQLFPSGKKGAVVVMNYKTGEVYALYSAPTFDVYKIDQMQGEDSAQEGLLVNRATQGQYAPGSIFKVITLAAGLTEIPDLESQAFHCEGEREIGAFTMSDNAKQGHGDLGIHRAFNVSCNLTFAQIGLDTGRIKLERMAESFAFNDNFLFRDLIVYPSTFPSGAMSDGILAWTSVGQGDLIVSPMHMAMVAASIANGGMMMEPKLIKTVQGGRSLSPVSSKQVMGGASAQVLRDYMRDCVENGTAARASFTGGTACGKTGTAQVATSGQGIEPHSWYIGFNDDDEKPLAIAVIIEQGGSGSAHAAPLAGNVLGRAAKSLF